MAQQPACGGIYSSTLCCHVLTMEYLCVSSSDATSVQQLCQNTLHDFNLCMFRQESDQHPSASSVHSADDKPNRLSNEMVFKIIVVCLAMIHIMQKDGQFDHIADFDLSPLFSSLSFWLIFSFISHILSWLCILVQLLV